MTEEEWLSSPGAWSQFQVVRPHASSRKLRLFGCACVRRTWSSTSPRISQAAVEAAEAIADGTADDRLRQEAYSSALSTVEGLRTELEAGRRESRLADFHAARAAMALLSPEDDDGWTASTEASKVLRAVSWANQLPGNLFADERDVQAKLIRCIFGNPFRPLSFDPHWRTEDVLGLARGIYEDRAFDRLPLLADALMDAGCDDDQVLGHCRSEGPHARGCWVVDLALGKA
jgi:hypothetical protein